jgi:UDP-GlcNAc3NAcA epimerase
MQKILTVVGARPQFIKAAPVSKAISESKQLLEVLVHSGQHYDANMSGKFFEELELRPPQYNLEVGSGGHGVQTGEIMKRLEPVLEKEAPKLVIVYGDTNSTLAGALTASKLHIPVAHVEAGLRSFNKEMPEEINRIVADHVSTLRFCPTTRAVQNLQSEGIRENVFEIGDVMYDAALNFSQKAKEKSSIIDEEGLKAKGYVLATVHRAENTDDGQRLSNIFSALSELGREVTVVVPLHPRTRKMLLHFGLEDLIDGIRILEPVGFLDMVSLESNARVIVTDSGGVQKEAYFHRVPCVTLRDETEWIETLEAQWNVLANVDFEEGIAEMVRSAITSTGGRPEIREYGDGRASQKIVCELERYLCSTG